MAGLVPAIHVLSCLRRVRTWMPGTRPGMTRERLARLLGDRVVQVVPIRVVSQDQPHLPFARPVLDVVLPLNRGLNVFVELEIDETLDRISFGEAGDQPIPMFVDAFDEIARP